MMFSHFSLSKREYCFIHFIPSFFPNFSGFLHQNKTEENKNVIYNTNLYFPEKLGKITVIKSPYEKASKENE